MNEEDREQLKNVVIKVETLDVSIKEMLSLVRGTIRETILSLNDSNDARLTMLEKRVEELERLRERCDVCKNAS